MKHSFLVRFTLIFIAFFVFSMAFDSPAFSQTPALSAIKKTSSASATLEVRTEETTTEQKPEYSKEPVIIKEVTVLYVGEENEIKAKQRALTIQENILKAIEKALSNDINDKAIIKKEKEINIISILDVEVATVTQVDAIVNKQGINKLAEIWKSNIDLLLNKLELKEFEKNNRITTRRLFIGFIVLIFIVIIVEIIRRKLKKLIKILESKSFNHFDDQIRIFTIEKIKKEKLKEKEENPEQEIAETTEEEIEELCKQKEEELKNKISVIGQEINKFLLTVVRLFQVISIIIYTNYALYNYPPTYPYVSGFTHYTLGILSVLNERVLKILENQSTWESLGSIIILIIITIFLLYLTNLLSTGIENIILVLSDKDKGRQKRIQTISKIIRTTIKILLIVISGLVILSELGLNVTPIVAGASILGLAISFGSQSLVKDIINGIFILMEDQFGIGDIIVIGDTGGKVEDMTLRVTVLRDIAGKVHIIPNGDIIRVTVLTKSWARADLEIKIAYDTDIDKAIEVIEETGHKLKEDFPDKIIGDPKVLGVNRLGDSAIFIKFIMEVVAGEQRFTERNFRKRIIQAFKENNIRIPYPRTIVHFNDKEPPENF